MKPPALKLGDTIGVMAPSSYVEKDDIEKSKAVIEARGYQVFVHPQTYERHNQSAGTVAQKVAALKELWLRDDIKVIWTAGGGNRALNMLEHIDFHAMADTPKALIGFSDITALLNSIYARTGIQSFHGPVFKNIHSMNQEQLTHALHSLAGDSPEILMDKARVIRGGQAEGSLIGGCLSVFQYLIGSADCPDMDGAILFLEDAGDHISRIDRMLLHLKRNGVFEKISGLILGEFLDMQDGARAFGFSLDDIIQDYTQGRDIPIIANAPFGHGDFLFTLPLGAQGVLSTAPRSLKVSDISTIL